MIHLLPHSAERIISKKTPEDIYIILKSVTDSGKAAALRFYCFGSSIIEMLLLWSGEESF